MSPPVGPQRVFGGQVAGQALVAAGRTVDPARQVHSLHGYFVRPGDPTEPIDVRGREHPRRAVVLGPPLGGVPARQADLLHVGVVPAGRGGARPPARRPRWTCPAPDERADDGRAARAVPGAAAASGRRSRARSTCATSASRAGCRPGDRPARRQPAGLDAHRRQAARRSAAARVRADLRLRPDAARRGALACTARCGARAA